MGVYFDNGHEAILKRKVANEVTSETMQPLMRLVYLWMMVGLVVTAVVAGLLSTLLYNQMSVLSFQEMRAMSGNVDMALFACLVIQFIVIAGVNAGMQNGSRAMITGMFFVYSTMIATIVGLAVFNHVTYISNTGELAQDYMPVAKAFFITAGLFGAMSVIGYTTKIDLTRFGTFLGMGFFGLMIACFASWIFRSDAFGLAISVFGVLLFTGLTAFHTQRIKELASQVSFADDSVELHRLAITSAMSLYAAFVNLFLALMNLTSRR